MYCLFLSVKVPHVNIHDSEAKFKHITEMTILTVQLTVEFSKRLPGFDTLLREDQITLLKVDQFPSRYNKMFFLQFRFIPSPVEKL